LICCWLTSWVPIWYDRSWAAWKWGWPLEAAQSILLARESSLEMVECSVIILFLDIDGVLHPYAPWPHDELVRAQYFRHLPRLEAVLRDFPEVRVVIASDWRFHHTLDALRSLFSEDIRERVCGTTTTHRLPGNALGDRQRQAEQYLRDHNLDGVRWVAIDDIHTNYFPGARLVRCKEMFGEREESELRRLLLELSRVG
jgi:HAD domain in Swiss Army Knife RNA repair proteins